MNAIWYFAYGSNMHADVFSRRRQIRYQESQVAFIDDYDLTFSAKGLWPFEPAFANIEYEKGCSVYGIAYLLTAREVEKIVATEGKGYRLTDIEIFFETGSVVQAKTLMNVETVSGLLPSRRYLNLIVDGARSSGLPTRYIEKMEKYDCHHIPVLSSVFNYLLSNIIFNYFRLKIIFRLRKNVAERYSNSRS